MLKPCLGHRCGQEADWKPRDHSLLSRLRGGSEGLETRSVVGVLKQPLLQRTYAMVYLPIHLFHHRIA